MNSIKVAMNEAGIKLPPLKNRVFQWLKDHPDKTSMEVAIDMKEPRNNISSMLSSLANDGRVVRDNGFPTRYSTAVESFNDKPSIKVVNIVPTPATPTFNPEQLLSGCTLKELRITQAWLNKIFK